MNLLIDMTHINIDQLLSSTSIYVFRIINSFDSTIQNKITLLISPELEEYINKEYPNYKYIIFPYTNKIVSKHKKGISKFILQTRKYRQYVNNSKCDGLLIANNLLFYTCIPTQLKKLVIIHDLKAIKDRTRLQKILNYIFYALLIISSHKTIAISNFTKQDILRYYSKFIQKKIEVVYNSIQLSEKITLPKNFPNNLKYILYVNTLHKYKNIETLLEAITLIKKINHKLVVVGKSTSYWENTLIPYIKKNNLHDKIIHLETVTDEELHYLYKNASLFISCSTREGFGYTPIEAAICECPVICSTCEALPETTLNQLEYYNPVYDAIELSNKIKKILTSPPSSSSLKATSQLFLNKYSPEKQAQNIYNLLTYK